MNVDLSPSLTRAQDVVNGLLVALPSMGVGVIVFVALTAYDTRKLKMMAQTVDAASEEGRRASISGALALYLDFINLFLMLLRVFGNRR